MKRSKPKPKRKRPRHGTIKVSGNQFAAADEGTEQILMDHGLHADSVFSGELMKCVICNCQEQSEPGVESQWRALTVDGKTWYACPDEFPPDRASPEKFKNAYQRVLMVIQFQLQLLDLTREQVKALQLLKKPVDWNDDWWGEN